MGIKKELTLEYNIYAFSVYDENGIILDGGSFGYNGRTYFTDRTCYVELFAKPLEAKVVKLLKRDKETWKKMLEFQNSKK